MEGLKLQQTIGSGTFGKVKRALHLPTATPVAVKILNKHRIASQKDAIRIKREIAILKRVDHPNIIRLLQLVETAKSFMLVTNLAEGEELFQLINRRGALGEEESGELFVQLLDAVLHLRSKNIAHRDIKPENIIVSGGQLTLIDFGLGRVYAEGEMLFSSCGSHCYAAPEMMTAKSYEPEKTEVWALGVTLYAMLSGRLPFQHSNPAQLLKLMIQNRYEQLPHISDELSQLLRSMIEAKPGKRISLNEIKKNKWVQAFQHEFSRVQEKKWDEELLLKMEGELGLKREPLLHKIQYQFGNQTIQYHLRAWKQQNNRSMPYHRGPIHINLVFSSVQAAKAWVNSEMQRCLWVEENKAELQERRAQVRQLQGGLFYVHLSCLSPKQSVI